MGTINTRVSIRTSNTFRNTISLRHDKAYPVESRVDQGTRLIKETTSGSPHELASGTDYYDSSETGALANQVYVFVRNNSAQSGATITVQFNNNGVRDSVIKLNAGEFTVFPWLCDAATDKLELFSSSSSGIKIEYLISPML
jgi:hypothetical protein